MNELNKEMPDNPMQHPDEQPSGVEGTPKFGRLLIVLGCAVLFIVLLTMATVTYYAKP